jgi:hypothetical protein
MAYENEWTTAVLRQDSRAFKHLASSQLSVVNADGTRVFVDERAAEIAAGKMRERPGQVDEYLNTRVFGSLAVVSGRSTWHPTPETTGQEYFLRIWERSTGGWRLVAAHYTPVPRRVVTPKPLVRPGSVLKQTEPVMMRAIDPGRSSPDDVIEALHEQHRLYWERNVSSYSQYIGDDLLRVAEMGVRTKSELIDTMGDKLFRPKTPQVDERVHMAGNSAVVTWRDAGVADDGTPTQSWFTMVFVKRDAQWQIVQIHSTGIPIAKIPTS